MTPAASSTMASTTRGERISPRARAQKDRRLLVRYHRDGDSAAREQLVERFLPLARQLARRYQRGGEPYEDLVQVASIGLLKAIDRFDAARETAFSSFAVPTILGELKRHFRDTGWAVRVPRDLQELAVKIDRIADDMSDQLGRAPTLVEIAERTGSTLEQVLEAHEAHAAHRAISLDRPLAHDEDRHTVADSIGVADPGFDRAEASVTLQQLMNVLSEREREVLRLRFQEDLTQSEIGARVGLSQMHVSRLIRESIALLHEEATHVEPGERGEPDQPVRRASAPAATQSAVRGDPDDDLDRDDELIARLIDWSRGAGRGSRCRTSGTHLRENRAAAAARADFPESRNFA
jgi:RNA polymerase sigma-B factor